MSHLIIRPMQDADCEPMAKLHARAVMAAYPAAYGDEVARDWANSRRPEKYLKAREAGERFLVAEHAGKIAGFGSWGESSGELSILYVDPYHQGQGVGAALFQAMKAASHATPHPITWVKAALPAQDFYKKMGFHFKEFVTTQLFEHRVEEALMTFPPTS